LGSADGIELGSEDGTLIGMPEGAELGSEDSTELGVADGMTGYESSGDGIDLGNGFTLPITSTSAKERTALSFTATSFSFRRRMRRA